MEPTAAVRFLGEDDQRIYAWKPAGLPVFPPHADPGGACLIAAVLAQWPERARGWPVGFEAGVAHRLDTATSGLVILAKDPAALVRLRAEFSEGKLRKFYRLRSTALVVGDDMIVTLPIAHDARKRDRMVVQNGPRTTHRGRWYPAWTAFTRLEEGVWQAEIRTGVMHQIRVHALAAGIPLDGDLLYRGTPGRAYSLHHHYVLGPDWSSPVAPLPQIGVNS